MLSDDSRGSYGQKNIIQIWDVAKNSIGFRPPAKSLRLNRTILLIRELDNKTAKIESEIDSITEEIHSPIINPIPGIGTWMGTMILIEIGDFSNFDSVGKILAYAAMYSFTCQSE